MAEFAKRWIWPEDLSKFPEHAVLIAAIISRWSAIEDICASLLIIFSRTPNEQIAQLMLRLPSARGRTEFIHTAGKLYLKDAQDDLQELADIFSELEGRYKIRDRFAHCLYVSNERGELCILQRKFIWPEKKSTDVVHVNSLKNELQLMRQAEGRLVSFRQKLWNQLPLSLQQSLKGKWLPPTASDLPSQG